MRPTLPILYLDIDGVLLRGVPPPGAGPEARERELVPAKDASDFLLWTARRFEIRWATAWAPSGALRPQDQARLSEALDVPRSLLATITGDPWQESKIEAIDMEERRAWWWVDDGPPPRDLEALRAAGLAHRWIECRSDVDPGALRGVRRRLERKLRRPGQ